MYSLHTTAQLTADFSIDKKGGCAPLAVIFTNNSTGATSNAIYSWDFGNGNTSAIASPGAIYNSEKTYNITLTVKDGSLTSTKTKQVTVYAPPLVDFTVSPIKGCLPVTVNFTASAAGNANTYTWDFGDGNTQQDYNPTPSHTYTVPQTATVSLTVSNSYGCSNTLQKDNLIKILPPISAAFSASQLILCRVTDAVQFTNSSYGPGTLTYLWDFGDGTTSTQTAPSHVFNKRGNYTVALTVTSSEGCTNTSSQNGSINVANFTSDFTVPTLTCLNAYVSFTNISTPSPSNSSWYVDGVNNYYNYYGNFNYSFPATGPTVVKLVNTFGTCVDSVSKTLTVNQIPDLKGFVATTNGRCGSPILYNFSDTTIGAVKWEWDFDNYNNTVQATDQSPSYTYTLDGGYSSWLRVTNAAGCTAQVYKYISIVREYVTISAQGTRAKCGPYSLSFTSTSTVPIATYNWNFGDGGTSDLAEPTHLFSSPGSWNITLSYKTGSGCTGTVSYGSAEVNIQPKAAFTVANTTVCGNTPVTFLVTPYPGEDNYTWDFGDGFGYTNSNSSHQYTYDSTYSVSLIVFNRGGCSDTMTRKAYIKVVPPFPHIGTATNTCDGTRGLVTFTQDSKKAQTWTWDFGDGTSKLLNVDNPQITHPYLATGTYKVVLTTTNGQCSVRDSLISNRIVHVLLKQSPLLAGNATQVCNQGSIHIQINNLQNNPVHYTYDNDYNIDQLQNDDGSAATGVFTTKDNDPTSYYWLTNYQGTANNFSVGHNGLRVILRSAGFNCLDTTNTIPVKVNGSNAGITVLTDNVCFKLPVVLKDASTTNNKIVSWTWNFGDGTSQTTSQSGTASHIYSYPSIYNVSLTITDAQGCSTSTSSATQTVSVNGPKAAFYPSINYTYITLPVNFYNNTNNYNSYNTTYKWFFGDGSSSTDYSPSHTYNLPGQYPVTLIALNPLTGCADTTSQVITVNNFEPAFTTSSMFLTGNACPPILVKMQNKSSNYTSVKWDFGDGTTADNLNYPSHIYEKAGKYIITLYVYGYDGLSGTFTDSVIIKLPNATLSVNTKEGCIGLTPTFKATVQNTSSYLWDYGDGTIITNTLTTTTHQYNQPGLYLPLLMLNDLNGCSSIASLTDTINVHPNPTVTLTPQDPRICRGQSVTITASGGYTYSWSPTTGLSNALIANPSANPIVTTSYIVTAKDNFGCSNTGNQKITVVQPIKISVSPNNNVCMGKSMQLNVSGATFYKWIATTTGLSDTQISNPIATPQTTTTYTVTGTEEYHCFTDTANITITVLPLPTVSILPVPETLLGASVPLNIINSPDVVQWNWSPAASLSCSTCAMPVATPIAQTTYSVTVTNNNGCQATAAVLIKLQCEENRVFTPAAFSPNGDGKNDVFSIMGISRVKHLIIYSRWGKPIYERSNFIASDRSTGWDGTYKGEPQAAGTYAYYAEMECPQGGSFTKAGTVTLVR